MEKEIERAKADEAVEHILGPFLGSSMSRAAFDGHCRRLGVARALLTAAELESVMQGLIKGLRIFVGRRQSEELIRQLKTAILAARRGDEATAGR